MIAARSQSWEAALQVLHGISTIDEIDEFGAGVLEHLDVLVPSDLASFNEVDPVAGRASVIGRPWSISADQLEVWEQWSHQNPALMHMLRTGDGSARRLSDFLSADELHELELYSHVYGPLGVEFQVAVGLPAPQPVVLGIALNRFHRDFTDHEVVLLNALRPHLVQAYRRVQLLSERHRLLERITGTLHDEGRTFLVIGAPPGDLAATLLSSHFGGASAHLPPPVQQWLDEEQAALASGHPERLSQPMVSYRHGRRLTIRFIPGGSGPNLLWLHEQESEHDATPLRRLGLTERQAQVLWLLTKGISTKEIAQELDLSVGTVKKHLEHVYRKLGVSTGTAAVAQAFDALTATPGE
jgi:DNA-binding CsgD family transcriptional regulator